MRPTLFDAFVRGAESGAGPGEGFGLGLFIARQIALAHGGTIAVCSTSDEGTTLAVRLPWE